MVVGAKTKDLTNQTFGELTVLQFKGYPERRAHWECLCSCGKTCVVRASELTSGVRRSCGHLKKTTFVNLIGMKNGKLTVVKYLGKNKQKQRIWVLQCECGNSIKANTKSIKRKEFSSCGCSCLGSRKAFGEAALNALYKMYERKAKDRGHFWNLEKEDFIILTKKICYYCGNQPMSVHRNTSCPEAGHYVYNGIDRVDNDLGYIKSNCVTACTTCNYAKHSLPQQEFLNWIERSYKNLKNNGLIND